jgi:hypothetical protein
MQDGVVAEEGNPFLGLGLFGWGCTTQFGASIFPFDQTSPAKPGDYLSDAMIFETDDSGFHSGGMMTSGVGQTQGNGRNIRKNRYRLGAPEFLNGLDTLSLGLLQASELRSFQTFQESGL